MKSSLPSSATFDWNRWVGLPFVTRGRGPNAYDCWGLVRSVLLEVGHELPLFLEDGVATPEQKASLDQWAFVHAGTPQSFDVIIFDLGHQSLHLGLVCGPQMFLHITYGKTSVVERFINLRWRSRLKGFYRYGGLAQD
ncbi:MAG: NlpC/P60 family protein [Nitrospirales bacterium]|nr:C40 family peptidase [Nitrospirales bacterium]